MYSPSYYREERLDLIHELIESFNFGTLLTTGGDGLKISHLPFLLEKLTPQSSPQAKLLCHMARANDHWNEFSQSPQVTVVFQGPHAYISPAWYEPKPANVPTWNYAVVHVRGHAKIIDDPALAYEVMQKLVGSSEERYGTGWRLPDPKGPALEKLMAGIVVFEIRELSYEAKLKLSQKLESRDRDNVIQQLQARMTDEATGVARLMEKTRSEK